MLTFVQEVATVHDNIDEVFDGYLDAALYFSCDDVGVPYSVFYEKEDFLDEDLVEVFIEVSSFLAQYRNVVKGHFEIPLRYIGEDLWLSQHSMGEGFESISYKNYSVILDTLAKQTCPKSIFEKDGMLRIVTKHK